MTTKDDGGPAFPVPYSNEADGPTIMPTHGKALRDWFAGMAMQGQMANGVILERHGLAPDEVAKAAYAQADAMLAERAK